MLPSKVLILRSCRLSQFLAAVVLARTRNPQAEIVALSHRGHRQILRAAGVDRVIEVPGSRFGILNMPPWTLARIRKTEYDEVIIPQMTDDIDAHINLYRVVLALKPARVVTLPGDARPQVYDRGGFTSLTLQHSYSGSGLSRAAMFVGAAYLARLARG
jgi:hypothetical protein